MTTFVLHRLLGATTSLLLLALSACTSMDANPSLEQRYTASTTDSTTTRYVTPRSSTYGGSSAMDLSGRSTSTASGASTYVVQPGDTLNRIAIAHGTTWKELALLNRLDNPDVIEVGQVLRVSPQGEDDVSTAPATVPTRTPRVETRPLDNGVDTSSVNTDAQGVRWSWPASGPVLAGFGDKASKGVSIAGRAGDPVMAAADGRVVYAGSGLRGYGNLVIVKHANDYLTAYAHNQALLVKEDQTVRRGQRIAEMGSVDADRVMLHFELRRQGKPLDPLKYLPVR